MPLLETCEDGSPAEHQRVWLHLLPHVECRLTQESHTTAGALATRQRVGWLLQGGDEGCP